MGPVDAHMLDASRDLMTELGARGSTWGRVLADLKIPSLPQCDDGSDDPLGRVGLEADLRLLAGDLRKASPVLGRLEADLSRIAEAQATVGRVELVPVPPNVDELARSIQVVLHQGDQLSLPLRFHGLGSRSLAALFVFQTLCELRIGADQGLRPHLLILLEEPEAHLHPQAVIALRDLIDALPGQTVVATHSTHLVAESSPEFVRLVRRSPHGTRILRLPPQDAKRIAQFRRFIERPFGEIFFARLVIFVDGTSERNALPILLRPALGCDVGGLGVTFIDCESMVNDKRLQRLVDALHAVEIAWLMFVDNDADGIDALEKITDPATGETLTVEHSRVVLSGAAQIEQLLIDAGYEQEIEATATEANTPITDGEHLKFLKANKAWAAEAVARRAVLAGRPSHPTIRELAAAIPQAIEAGYATNTSAGGTG
jgi:putative ATP-dependent endonuclease of OLD family